MLNANTIGGGPRGIAENLEPGNYPARLLKIILIGVQNQRPYQGEPKPPVTMARFTYELGTEFMKDEAGNDMEDKPRLIDEEIAIYGLQSDKAKSTARYKSLDPKIEHGGVWDELIGKPCLVAVVNNVSQKNGKTYDNIAATSVPMKGLVTPELVNEPVVFTEFSAANAGVFNSFPDFIQEKIQGANDYVGSELAAAIGGGQEDGAGEVGSGGEALDVEVAENGAVPGDADYNDDIPF